MSEVTLCIEDAYIYEDLEVVLGDGVLLTWVELTDSRAESVVLRASVQLLASPRARPRAKRPRVESLKARQKRLAAKRKRRKRQRKG